MTKFKLSAQGNSVAGFFGRVSVYENELWLYNKTVMIKRVTKIDALMDAKKEMDDLLSLNGMSIKGA